MRAHPSEAPRRRVGGGSVSSTLRKCGDSAGARRAAEQRQQEAGEAGSISRQAAGLRWANASCSEGRPPRQRRSRSASACTCCGPGHGCFARSFASGDSLITHIELEAEPAPLCSGQLAALLPRARCLQARSRHTRQRQHRCNAPQGPHAICGYARNLRMRWKTTRLPKIQVVMQDGKRPAVGLLRRQHTAEPCCRNWRRGSGRGSDVAGDQGWERLGEGAGLDGLVR